MAQNGVSTEGQHATGRSARLMSRDGPTGEGVDQYSAIRRGASSGARFALTKVRVPMLPGTLVTRSVLHDRLTSGTDKQLTLVVGSAGTSPFHGRDVRTRNGVVRSRPTPDCSRSALHTTARPDQCECTASLPAHLHTRLLDPSCRRSAAIFASSLLVPDPVDAQLAGGIEHSST
jgi:hypothetical protein